jgi:hypothetical protein
MVYPLQQHNTAISKQSKVVLHIRMIFRWLRLQAGKHMLHKKGTEMKN